MYTFKEQSELLLQHNIIPDSADMVCFAGKSKTDPYKSWAPVSKLPLIEKEAKLPKEKRKLDFYDPKVWMPAWSESCLFNMLPRKIIDRKENIEYEINIVWRYIPGRGNYICVGYFNNDTGGVYHAFMHTELMGALLTAVTELLGSNKQNYGDFIW